jgi:cell fate (sporulation/competence/biofilm development) regulator YmcA (YheA/YmcA/DUF963 family)
MMTRKDYIATADILETMVSSTDTVEEMNLAIDAIDAFAEMFAKDNPRFDRTRFVRACGIYEHELA